MQGAWVRSLVRELRSQMLQGSRTKNKMKNKVIWNTYTKEAWFSYKMAWEQVWFYLIFPPHSPRFSTWVKPGWLAHKRERWGQHIKMRFRQELKGNLYKKGRLVLKSYLPSRGLYSVSLGSADPVSFPLSPPLASSASSALFHEPPAFQLTLPLPPSLVYFPPSHEADE